MCLLPARVNVCPRVRCTDPPGEISKSNHAKLLVVDDVRWFEMIRTLLSEDERERILEGWYFSGDSINGGSLFERFIFSKFDDFYIAFL